MPVSHCTLSFIKQIMNVYAKKLSYIYQYNIALAITGAIEDSSSNMSYIQGSICTFFKISFHHCHLISISQFLDMAKILDI